MTNVRYSEAVNKPRKGVIPGPIMPRYPLRMKMGEPATTIPPSNSYKPVQEDREQMIMERLRSKVVCLAAKSD